MPQSGLVGLAIDDPSVDEMERTHELARTIHAPDLDEGRLKRDAESGKAFPATHSASFAHALGESARANAQKSIAKRRIKGWCRKGHELTPENLIGNQCRTCRNAWKKERRAKGLAA